MSEMMFGRKPTILKTNDAIEGKFYLIKALEASEVEVEVSWSRSTGTETITLPAQGTLEQVDKVTVNSGVVLGFRK